LSDGGEKQGGFHHREAGTNAYAGTAAEREVGEAGEVATADGIVAPALWIEALGVRKIVRRDG
jgi:hypothetical protein